MAESGGGRAGPGAGPAAEPEAELLFRRSREERGRLRAVLERLSGAGPRGAGGAPGPRPAPPGGRLDLSCLEDADLEARLRRQA